MKGLFSKIAAACLLAATAQTGSAQFYVGLNAGYAFSTTNDRIGTSQTYSSTGALTSDKAIFSTIGAGVPAQLNFGYFFNKNIRFDFGVSYFAGKKTTASEYTRTNETFSAKAQTMQMRLNPSLIVQMGEGKVQPFTRFGLVLPVSGKTTTTALTTNTSSTPYTSTVVLETKGAISLGFEAGAGVAYMVNDNIGITGELTYTGLRIKGAEQTMTKNELVANGTTTDMLTATTSPSRTTYAQQVVYQDELTSSSNNPNTAPNRVTDSSKARNELATTTNFSNLAIRVGVFYKFGGSKE